MGENGRAEEGSREAASGLPLSRRAGGADRRPRLRLPRKARLPLALVVLSFLVLVIVAAAMEVASAGRMSPGIKIGGRPVGGMTRAGALRVAREVVAPLGADITLTFEDRQFLVKPADIGFKSDPEAMVYAAYLKGRGGTVPARLFRRIFGVEYGADIPVLFTFDRPKLAEKLAYIQKAVDREPESARITVASGSPEIIDSRNGAKMNVEETREAVEKALPTLERRVAVVADSIKPEITSADVGMIILINLTKYRLYLYDRENLVDYYMVGVGLPQYPTPTGRFHITYKEKNPSWLPTSEWAKDKQGKLQPPGKDNPLGDYWFDLGNGLGIHGTPFVESLGGPASHGCIRMRNEDAKVLFDSVKVGTPVFIVQ